MNRTSLPHIFATNIIISDTGSPRWAADTAAGHILDMLHERRVITRPAWWDRWSVGFVSGVVAGFVIVAALTGPGCAG